jgi:hypothetical protein
MKIIIKNILTPVVLIVCNVLGACAQPVNPNAEIAVVSVTRTENEQDQDRKKSTEKPQNLTESSENSAKTSEKRTETKARQQDPNDPNSLANDPNYINSELSDFEPDLKTELQKSKGRQIFYNRYQKILNEYLDKHGDVDYVRLRRHRLKLINAIEGLEEIKPLEIMSWSREEKISFWINCYNAFTLKLVVDNYPIEPRWYMVTYPDNSIIQIPGAWTKNYFEVTGLQYNLNEIKNGLLLDRFDDVRIALALCNATKSGPFLRKEIYTARKLDTQLDEQVKRYIQSKRGMSINTSSNVLNLSNYFMMEKNVFTKFSEVRRFRTYDEQERAILNFIYPFLTKEQTEWLESTEFEVNFMKYDWELNEQSKNSI